MLQVRGLNWLLLEHIPDVMNTDCFVTYKVLRLLEADDKEGPTYTIQYIAENIESYKKYISDFALELRNKTFEKWGDAFVAFRLLWRLCNSCA